MAKKKKSAKKAASGKARSASRKPSKKAAGSKPRKMARKAAKRPARKSASRKSTPKKSTQKAPARKSPRPTPPRNSKKVGATPVAAGEMFGEGNWKADEEYREDLKEFSETHDTEALAHEAAEELEEEPIAGKTPPVPEEDDEEW